MRISFDVLASALQRVVAAVEARQKLIHLADRSDLGWRVVQHYMADLITDTDDEKRIKRPTKSAAAELKATQEKKGVFVFFLSLSISLSLSLSLVWCFVAC